MSGAGRVGLVGGSGVYDLSAIEGLREERLETPFGAPVRRLFHGPPGRRAGCVSLAARAGTPDLAVRDQLPGQRLRVQDARVRRAALGLGLREPAGGAGAAPCGGGGPVHRPDAAPRRHVFRRRDRRARESRGPRLPGARARARGGRARGRPPGPPRGDVRLHGRAPVLDARRVESLSVLGRGRHRDDEPDGGAAVPRGRDLLREPRARDRLRLLARGDGAPSRSSPSWRSSERTPRPRAGP